MKKKLITLFYDILSFLLTVTSLSFSSKACRKFLQQAKEKPVDVIIVPGVPLINGKWDPIMKARICWAKYLFEKGITKNVIFSGAAVYTPYYESKAMALYAEAIGIPKENIFAETLAEHSTENVFYSYKMAKQLGFSRIALASDPFQTKMLRKFTRIKVSPDITLLPIVFNIHRVIDSGMNDPCIDPQQAFVRDFISIRERAGFHKRFKGTRGFDIDHDAYK